MEFEAVIGLEIHVQLLTKSKAYCSDSAEYGGLPNTRVSPVSLAHPGTLPKHNKEVIEKAIMMGLALHCDITRYNRFDRKNYFYADLPKGYQITQDKTPVCKAGKLKIRTQNGEKLIGITRIHMEEDSGKSMHDQDMHDTLVDYNRAGVPLIEIVSEPEIRTGEEAYEYVSEIRKLVRYLDICDGNMEEGSLRCDANISVRPKGSTAFGVKVEVKNMNSFSNVKRAIECETERQISLINQGGEVVSETRGFNALKGETFSMRSKEAANDYRYFPEPDLPPFLVSEDMLGRLRSEMPELPEELYNSFRTDFGLSEYDARTITEDKHMAQYYKTLCMYTRNFKAGANWVLGPVKSYLNEHAIEFTGLKLGPHKIAELIALIDSNKLSYTAAAQSVFPELTVNSEASALEIAEKLNVIQTEDPDLIQRLLKDVTAKYPDKVLEYRNGKKGLLGLFVGEVMKLSQGKANPRTVNDAVREFLEKTD